MGGAAPIALEMRRSHRTAKVTVVVVTSVTALVKTTATTLLPARHVQEKEKGAAYNDKNDHVGDASVSECRLLLLLIMLWE